MAIQHLTYAVVGSAMVAGVVGMAFLAGESQQSAPPNADPPASASETRGVAAPAVVVGEGRASGKAPVAPLQSPGELEAAIREGISQRFREDSTQRMDYLREELEAETERVALLAQVVDELRKTASEHPEAAEAVDEHLRQIELEHRVHRARADIYRRLGAPEP